MYWFEAMGYIIGSPTKEGAKEAAIRFGISPCQVKEGKVYEFERSRKPVMEEK